MDPRLRGDDFDSAALNRSHFSDRRQAVIPAKAGSMWNATTMGRTPPSEECHHGSRLRGDDFDSAALDRSHFSDRRQAVIPAKAGIHVELPPPWVERHHQRNATMDPRLRGDDFGPAALDRSHFSDSIRST